MQKIGTGVVITLSCPLSGVPIGGGRKTVTVWRERILITTWSRCRPCLPLSAWIPKGPVFQLGKLGVFCHQHLQCPVIRLRDWHSARYQKNAGRGFVCLGLHRQLLLSARVYLSWPLPNYPDREEPDDYDVLPHGWPPPCYGLVAGGLGEIVSVGYTQMKRFGL